MLPKKTLDAFKAYDSAGVQRFLDYPLSATLGVL